MVCRSGSVTRKGSPSCCKQCRMRRSALSQAPSRAHHMSPFTNLQLSSPSTSNSRGWQDRQPFMCSCFPPALPFFRDWASPGPLSKAAVFPSYTQCPLAHVTHSSDALSSWPLLRAITHLTSTIPHGKDVCHPWIDSRSPRLCAKVKTRRNS